MGAEVRYQTEADVADRFFTLLAFGPRRDAIGRRYDLLRTGVPLKDLCGSKEARLEDDA